MTTTTTGYLITIRRPTGITETIHVIGDRFDNKVQRCEEIKEIITVLDAKCG